MIWFFFFLSKIVYGPKNGLGFKIELLCIFLSKIWKGPILAFSFFKYYNSRNSSKLREGHGPPVSSYGNMLYSFTLLYILHLNNWTTKRTDTWYRETNRGIERVRNLPNFHSEDRSRQHRSRGEGSIGRGKASLTACG